MKKACVVVLSTLFFGLALSPIQVSAEPLFPVSVAAVDHYFPSASFGAPKPGKFCAKKYHNKKKSGLKCTKDQGGKYWRWR